MWVCVCGCLCVHVYVCILNIKLWILLWLQWLETTTILLYLWLCMHKPPTPRSLQCFEYWRVKRHGAQSAKKIFVQKQWSTSAVSMNSFLTIKTFSFRRKEAISVSKPICMEHIGLKVHGRRKRTKGRCRGYLLFPAKLTACQVTITVLLSSCIATLA